MKVVMQFKHAFNISVVEIIVHNVRVKDAIMRMGVQRE